MIVIKEGSSLQLAHEPALKQLTSIVFALIFLFISACGLGKMRTKPNAMDKFNKFRKKEKLVAEQFNPGIADPTMKATLTEKINKAADDFQTLAKSNNATEKDYQDRLDQDLIAFLAFIPILIQKTGNESALTFKSLCILLDLKVLTVP